MGTNVSISCPASFLVTPRKPRKRGGDPSYRSERRLDGMGVRIEPARTLDLNYALFSDYNPLDAAPLCGAGLFLLKPDPSAGECGEGRREGRMTAGAAFCLTLCLLLSIFAWGQRFFQPVGPQLNRSRLQPDSTEPIRPQILDTSVGNRLSSTWRGSC
ncbi:hypothetical protein L1887_49687 [Cichorium endivia]|nr:hypothetical protein L1887_49687 [Cichorium endivia]